MSLDVLNNEVIFADIMDERLRAGLQWTEEFDAKNTPNDWVSYVTRYIGKAVDGSWNCEVFRENMVKAAGLCCAAIDWCDKVGGEMPKRHYD